MLYIQLLMFLREIHLNSSQKLRFIKDAFIYKKGSNIKQMKILFNMVTITKKIW